MYEQGLRNDRDPVHPVEINTTMMYRMYLCNQCIMIFRFRPASILTSRVK